MNTFKMYGDREFNTLDIHLNTSDYSAKFCAKRTYTDYDELAKQLKQRAENDGTLRLRC